MSVSCARGLLVLHQGEVNGLEHQAPLVAPRIRLAVAGRSHRRPIPGKDLRERPADERLLGGNGVHQTVVADVLTHEWMALIIGRRRASFVPDGIALVPGSEGD